MILCMEYMLQLSANLLNIRLPILWRKLNTKLWKSSESSVFRYLSTENWVSTEEFRKNNESTRLGFAVQKAFKHYCEMKNSPRLCPAGFSFDDSGAYKQTCFLYLYFNLNCYFWRWQIRYTVKLWVQTLISLYENRVKTWGSIFLSFPRF